MASTDQNLALTFCQVYNTNYFPKGRYARIEAVIVGGAEVNTILLVEDSDEHQLVVSRALTNADIELIVTDSLETTQTIIKSRGSQFDLVILDLFLPDSDGFAVLEYLRSVGMPKVTPIFFLTSESELNSKVTAFNLGVDDYLIKPISPVELRARVDMRLRKLRSATTDTITRGELVIEMSALRAYRVEGEEQKDLSLTAKEFKILALLIQNENKVFTRSEVVSTVWGKEVHVLDRTVDSHIYGLRKKLGPIANYVESIPNAGYRFITPRLISAAG